MRAIYLSSQGIGAAGAYQLVSETPITSPSFRFDRNDIDGSPSQDSKQVSVHFSCTLAVKDSSFAMPWSACLGSVNS